MEWFPSLYDLSPWHWAGLGLILLISELAAGLGYLLWIGGSALVIALLLWIWPGFPWQAQLIGFAGLSVISAVVWRKRLKASSEASDEPLLNTGGRRFIGRSAPLVSAIENGQGYLKIDDSRWRVRGPELPEGTVVKIVDYDDPVLIVEPVEK